MILQDRVSNWLFCVFLLATGWVVGLLFPRDVPEPLVTLNGIPFRLGEDCLYLVPKITEKPEEWHWDEAGAVAVPAVFWKAACDPKDR